MDAVENVPRYRPYDTNGTIWRYPVPEEQGFEEQLEGLLALLEGVGERYNSLRGPEGEADLWLGFSSHSGQAGAFLPASVLSRIAALKLDIILDLYLPDVDSYEMAVRRKLEEAETREVGPSPGEPNPSTPTQDAIE